MTWCEIGDESLNPLKIKGFRNPVIGSNPPMIKTGVVAVVCHSGSSSILNKRRCHMYGIAFISWNQTA